MRYDKVNGYKDTTVVLLQVVICFKYQTVNQIIKIQILSLKVSKLLLFSIRAGPRTLECGGGGGASGRTQNNRIGGMM